MKRAWLCLIPLLLLSACRVWALDDEATQAATASVEPTTAAPPEATAAPALTPIPTYPPQPAEPVIEVRSHPAAIVPTPELDHGLPTVRVTLAIISGTQPAEVRAFAVGDSVMLGAAAEMKKMIDGLDVDAQVSRHVGIVIDIVRQRREAGRLGRVVIVHIGDNGYIKEQQLDDLMQLLADVPRVIVVNLKLPRAWEGPNNELLAAAVKRHPNAVLLDWHAASADKPELFGKDGLHLGRAGARFYAEQVAALVNAPR